MSESLPTVTVTGSPGSPGDVPGNVPGSTTRGDPHRIKKSEIPDALKAQAKARSALIISQRLNVEDSTPAPEPDASVPEPDATVVVTTNAPTLSDVDPQQLTYVRDARGDTITPAPPYPVGQNRPLPLQGAGPSQSFLGPQPQLAPEPLPEVVVQAQRPPPTPTRPLLAPTAFGFPNPYALGLAFLLHPSVANLGEQERVKEQQRADLSQRLLPVTVSVQRLDEPVATVTVRSERVSGGASPRTARGLPSSPLPGFQLRSLGVGFLAQPTSRLKPSAQNKRRPRVSGSSSVSFDLGNPFVSSILREEINRYAPTPRAKPKPAPAPEPFVPILPGDSGVSPLVPGRALPIGSITPIPQQLEQPQPLPQFQGQCSCPQTQTKTKKKKRRRVRTRCYRGVFIEKSDRVNKQRLEEIPCNVDLRRKGSKSKKPPK